ncbi:unnamed protein product [Heterobilharzia americana]|nr:unnamed protein product [Heterobilharzia americana]
MIYLILQPNKAYNELWSICQHKLVGEMNSSLSLSISPVNVQLVSPFHSSTGLGNILKNTEINESNQEITEKNLKL